jgi:hypothetical protein
MVDALIVELTQRENAIVWQSPASKPVRGPTPILNGEPAEELVLQGIKGEPDLLGSWQRGAALKAGQVRLACGVGARYRELPAENPREPGWLAPEARGAEMAQHQ